MNFSNAVRGVPYALRVSVMLSIRAQGAKRGYYIGFDQKGFVAAFKQDFGLVKVAETPFIWEYGKPYVITLTASKNRISCCIDGEKVLAFTDSAFEYGMYGPLRNGMGRTLYGDIQFESDINHIVSK